MNSDENRKAFIALVLEGAMQSWGTGSKSDVRTTLPFPSKSGIVGVICASAGIERNNEGAIAEMAKIPMSIFVLKQGSVFVDFHTAGGALGDDVEIAKAMKDKRQWAFLRGAINTSHKKTTAMSHRHYLQDAKFAAVLELDREEAEQIAEALRFPKWTPFLGRKSCPPSRPIFNGIHDSREKAIESIVKSTGLSPVEEINQTDRMAPGTEMTMDVPINFESRTFYERRIRFS